jgi:Arc/MetJ family transcription regulator
MRTLASWSSAQKFLRSALDDLTKRTSLYLASRCASHRELESLPYSRIHDMDFHMKTTLNIDDAVMAELKREAARQGRTMSEMVESALRLLLRSQRKRGTLPALPSFHSGGALVDIADRDALYQAMEGR